MSMGLQFYIRQSGLAFRGYCQVTQVPLEHLCQRRPSPEAMMHFPLFQTPLYFRKKFRLWNLFHNFTFSRQIFIRQNFWWPFFKSHQPQIFNFPPIFLFQYISPLFREKCYFALLLQISALFSQISRVFLYFRPMCISFPLYFDRDAFMHHTMHV